MSIASDVTRIESAKAAIKAAIEGKGVTVPDGTLLDGMASLIESIEAGGGDGGFITGTFALAENTLEYMIALVEHVPDFLLVYRIDSTTPGDYVFTVIASARVGNEMYQVAYRNSDSPAALKSVCTSNSSGEFYGDLVRFRRTIEANGFRIELYTRAYVMIAGTYGYIFGNF